MQLAIGRHTYQPRDVLMLNHEAYEPIPLLPEGSRVAMVAFSIPRDGLKPRFRARITYDQPHIQDASRAELAIYLPLLPDQAQLEQVLHIKRDDFIVTFTALPDVGLRRESVNAHVTQDTPASVIVHPRNRETIAVAVVAAGDK
jgi:hypothetical protein